MFASLRKFCSTSVTLVPDNYTRLLIGAVSGFNAYVVVSPLSDNRVHKTFGICVHTLMGAAQPYLMLGLWLMQDLNDYKAKKDDKMMVIQSASTYFANHPEEKKDKKIAEYGTVKTYQISYSDEEKKA